RSRPRADENEFSNMREPGGGSWLKRSRASPPSDPAPRCVRHPRACVWPEKTCAGKAAEEAPEPDTRDPREAAGADRARGLVSIHDPVDVSGPVGRANGTGDGGDAPSSRIGEQQAANAIGFHAPRSDEDGSRPRSF